MCAQGTQLSEETPPAALVQLGCQVIHQHHGPPSLQVLEESALGQHQAHHEQLALTPGQHLVDRDAMGGKAQIRPVRSDACEAARPVGGGRRLQGVRQSSRHVPPGLIPDLYRHGQQALQGVRVHRQNTLQETVPLPMQRLPRLCHFLIPGHQGSGHRSFPQGGIPLTQRPPVALQNTQIGRFHVEQCPIHELTA